jgi:hypothetical protein
MRQLGFFVVIAATVVTGGAILAGCASRIQTIIVADEGGTPDASGIKFPPGSSGASGGSSGGTSGGSSGGTSGGSSGGTSGGSSGGTSGGSSGGTGCPDNTPIDQTQLPWAPPAKTPGACSAADLNTLVNYLTANPSATYAQWKAAGVPNATCRACVFGSETAAQWAPLAENASGALTVLNVGGCIAIASGNTTCGKAYQNWFDCRFEACAGCPSGDPSLQTCLASASKAGGACYAAFQAVDTTCGATAIGNAEALCDDPSAKYVFEGPIKAQCIGGIP